MTSLGDSGPIVVVGAGPAGSLMSIYLSHQGHDVTLYESRPDMRRVDISAGRSINLALATRGIVALAEVGVIDQVDAITIPMAGRMVHTHDGADLQPYGSRRHEVIHSVSRGDLNAILLDAAEATGRVTIEFEHRCTGVDFETSRALFTDEGGGDQMVEFGVLFGADGAGSAVRPDVIAANDGHVSEEPLDHGYKELTLPAGPGGEFQLDPNALHIWPRGEFMLIALANPEGNFTVTLFMPTGGSAKAAAPHTFEALDTPESVGAFFSDQFPDFVALTPDIAEQFLANPTGHLGTIRTTGWSLGSEAVLLGDAAHAIVPFHGQGMNAAMESCRILDRHLRQQGHDLEAAFASFEAERRPDTDAIADMAIDNYVEMRAGVTDDDYLLRRELALELERRWPDRLSPRYGMVMFTIMPYAEAKERAQRQAALLADLTRDCESIHDVDFDRAAALVAELPPLPPSADERVATRDRLTAVERSP